MTPQTPAPVLGAPLRQPAPPGAKLGGGNDFTSMGTYHYGGSVLQRRPASAPAGPVSQSGLPDDLRYGVEALSGINLSRVKVHYNSAKPARLQAHAYAQGSEIHLAAGQEQHLPHEAWHVVQQAQGRVAPTVPLGGAMLNDDQGLEREADAMGARAHRLGIAQTRFYDPHNAGVNRFPVAINAAAGQGIIQTKLSLNKQVITFKNNSVEEFLKGILTSISDQDLKAEFDQYFAENPDRLKHVMIKWAGAPENKKIAKNDYQPPPGKQQKAKVRHYDNADELALAALGEARSKQKKTAEKEYATEIVGRSDIFNELVDIIQTNIPIALKKYGTVIDNLAKLAPKNRRTYLEYVRILEVTTLSDVLTHPQKHTFGELVAAIHDVQELLYQTKNEELVLTIDNERERNLNNPHALPPERYQGSVLVGPLVVRKPVDRAWRGKEATPKPSNPHVKTALLLGNPTDMGPSMTAARMFILATDGGAGARRVKSLALALFAFWNRLYRRDITDVHRYHFTMDMAANFDALYSPFTPIDKESRQWQEEFNLRDVESEFDVYD
ncbi:DUF4157 domain-containing protein [Paraherbaspirillum soli]|uniref:DUF4157 domain-containing protein n=1 Tax=Paraherbaspirillum soli TaxID=631222 RepID=A0ABW0MER1_9BURK